MSAPTPDSPFHPDNAQMLNFIMLARIYDVLVTILRDSDEESALALMEVHFKGQLMTPPPWWNGEFLSDGE